MSGHSKAKHSWTVCLAEAPIGDEAVCRVIAWKVKLQAIRGIRIARHLSHLDRQGMHRTRHCIVQAGRLTNQISCGAASAHAAAAALSQAPVDCSRLARRIPRTFRPYSKHSVARVYPQPSKACAALLRRSQRGQVCPCARLC